MKKRVAFLAYLLVLTACQKAPNPTNGGYNGESPLKDLEVRQLDEATRIKLGADKEDLVLTLKGDRRILYTAEGTTASPGEFPSNAYRIEGLVTILTVSGSRTCHYYWDDNGNKIWQNSPHCPHR